MSDALTGTADPVLGCDDRDPTTKPTKPDRVNFLKMVLAGGPVAVTTLNRKAQTAGYLKKGESISQSRPFRRARHALGIKPYQPKGVKSGGWLWALPADQMPQDE